MLRIEKNTRTKFKGGKRRTSKTRSEKRRRGTRSNTVKEENHLVDIKRNMCRVKEWAQHDF